MANIMDSVGLNGKNRLQDVRMVQKLLNLQNLSPLNKLRVDGIAGDKTITAIRRYQLMHVGMRNPDGRVETSGKTFHKLKNQRAKRPKTSAISTPESRKMDREIRKDFVDPRVKQTGLTKKIITELAPKFQGVRAKVISGWLSDADLFWKVNYHWDYLLWMTSHSLKLDLNKKYKHHLTSIRSALIGCQPNPSTGYRTSPVGKPKDNSSQADMNKRHRIVSQMKREFKAITREAGLKRISKRTGKSFDYAAAPVAHPGTSKHSTGYALDIMGDNVAIKNICKTAGASLIFDEKSHVHVEFKNGVAG